jgi:hypothetical protein
VAQLQHRCDAFEENTTPLRREAFGGGHNTSSCSSLNEITFQLRYHGCDGSSGWPDVLHPRISPPSSSTTCAHCAQRDTNPREYKVGSGSLAVSASVCSSSASSKATTASHDLLQFQAALAKRIGCLGPTQDHASPVSGLPYTSQPRFM